jgi:hypothetical protein
VRRARVVDLGSVSIHSCASSSPLVDTEGRGLPQPSEDILRLTTEILRRVIRQRASKFSSTLSGREDVRLA